MFICEIWLFVWYFPQFCTSDMSKYGYLEVFQRVPSTSRYRESTVCPKDARWNDQESRSRSVCSLMSLLNSEKLYPLETRGQDGP